MPLHICICEHTHTHPRHPKPPKDVGLVKLLSLSQISERMSKEEGLILAGDFRGPSSWSVVPSLWTYGKEEHHGRGGMMEESCSPHNIWEEERRMDQEEGVSFGSILDPEHMSSWTLSPCTMKMMTTLSTSGLPNPGCSVSCGRVTLQWPISSK